MARAVLIWSDGERLKVADLNEHSAPTTIGRARGSGVDLSDATRFDRYKAVSREHAVVRAKDGAFFVDHISKTNPTKVNAALVESGHAHRLVDQDVIDVGGLQITFHDLAAGDRISGVVCPSCGRENEPSRKDCWYDGTNLVSALTSPRRTHRANCRIVSSDGEIFDLFSDEALTIQPNGRWQKQSREPGVDTAHAAIDVRDHQPVLSVRKSDLPLKVNGETATEMHALKTGDEVRLGDAALVVVVR